MSDGASAITEAIESASGPAVCAYVTAGYPDPGAFADVLRSVAGAADVVEVGVPFTDPMADGLTIQRASHAALEHGVSLRGILDTLEPMELDAPLLLMGYYNPFLAFGLGGLGEALARAGVSGLIIPDLPLEESAAIREVLEPHGIALVQLVTPSTPVERLAMLAEASGGFVYAVTVKGVTGGRVGLADEDLAYLQRVKGSSSLPVLAGFGIRTAADVQQLSGHVDGVVVGSALIEAIDRGDDPGIFLRGLRPEGARS